MIRSQHPCECGCGEMTWLATRSDPRYGAVKGEPRRFLSGHSEATAPASRWIVDEKTGCWMWRFKPNPGGYGMTKERGPNGRTITAHRWSWELHRGPIPRGWHIDHLCHKRDKTCSGGPTCPHRKCVNPDHLELVTPRENVLRGLATKLSDEQIEDAWVMRAGGESYVAIGKHFGVMPTTIRLRLLAMQNERNALILVTPKPPKAREMCSVLGCEFFSITRGYCDRHYDQWRKTGTVQPVKPGEVRGYGSGQTNKTHCPKGHEYTTENTRFTSLGHRQCIRCDVEKQRERRGVTELVKPRLTDGLRETIRRLAAQGKTQAEIVRQVGVSQASVSRTLNR